MRITNYLNGSVLGLALLTVPVAAGEPAMAATAPVSASAASNAEFAVGLYGQLKASPGNLFCSPYSVSSCLAMTYAGARGETERQMARALHFAGQAQVHSEFRQLQERLTEAGGQQGVQLNIANALWTQEGHPFLPDFLKTARSDYGADLNQADFQREAEKARARINQWAAEQTKEKIREILPAGSVNGLTRLVLANAIYFKGLWAKPFAKAKTADQPFHLSAAETKTVPLMHGVETVRYAENADFQAVELPYQGERLAMLILLPKQRDGIGAVESRLSTALLEGASRSMRARKVEIFLPRFTVESGFKLNGALAQLGMTDAFGPQADFSGIDGGKDLFISGIYHKAWGHVNEEGTEAAAATAGTIALTSVIAPTPQPVFRADHPFLFLIRETRSGSILFIGRLADPQQ